MTRRHADDVEVERGVLALRADGSPDAVGSGGVEGPVRFRWRNRWYAVAGVLEQWVEAGNWWQRAGQPGPGGAALGIDDGEREVWRVEAAGRNGVTGAYDLRFEWGTGRWSLIRVHD